MATTADPVLDALERLNTRLDALESKVDALGYLGHLGGRVPDIADAAGAGADFVWKSAEDAGIDPLKAGQRGVQVALKAADDRSLDLVEKLLEPDKIALVGKLVERTELLSLAVDTSDALLTELKAKNVDLNQLAKRTASIGATMASSLDVADKGSTALVEAGAGPVESVGPFGMFFKLMDADVQRAVGFSMAIAKKFGAAIK